MPGGVYSNADVLASDNTISLKDATVRCRLPGPFPAHLLGTPGQLTAPPDRYGSTEGWPEVNWGVINGHRAVTIYSLGVEFEFDELTLDQAAALERELNVWVTRLGGWLSVLAGGPTGFLSAWKAVAWPMEIAHELDLRLYRNGGIYEPERLSLWAWQHSLAHTAAGDPPPASPALLAVALTSALNEDYRPAVLDAATAVELALTHALSQRLRDRGADDEIVEALLRQRTLGALLQLGREFSLPAPTRINEDLVVLRNRVMHRASIPTAKEAHRAIHVAQAMVAELAPLPEHCDELLYLERRHDDWTSGH
jgi:hypothetical protein